MSRTIWLYYLVASAVEALAALVWLFALPSETSSSWLLGYSRTRWLFATLLLGLGIGLGGFGYRFYRNSAQLSKLPAIINHLIARPLAYIILIVIALSVFLVSGYLILIVFEFTDALVLARLQRLLPLIAWSFLVSLQSLIVFPQLAAEENEQPKHTVWLDRLLPAIVALAGIGLLVLLVSLTRLGLQPDRTGWDSPGVPLLGTQLLIAWLVAALIMVFIAIARRSDRSDGWLNLATGILIWLVAVILWQTQPLTPSFFAPRPQPPNLEYYPYSDAAFHDLVAQNLLVGEGFSPVSEKPLYSFFLAGLHTLLGQDYLRLISAQIVLLALFPTVLYAIARRIHHQFSGLLLAGAVILRERNAIALSGDINVSHSKLLMTDLPAALALAALTLMLLKWQQSGRERPRWPMLLGAALGFMVLLRSQSILLLPLLLLVVIFGVDGSRRRKAGLAGLALVGFMLAALPWLWRNYTVNGQFGYSQPLQARYLAKQYSWTPEANDPGFAEGTPSSEFVRLGFASAWEFTQNYPGEVARFISAHFIHNEVSSLLALPARFDLSAKMVNFYNLRPYWQDVEDRLWRECCSLDTYIAETPYWDGWNGVFPDEARLPLAINLALIALGVGIAWRQWGWVGLIPFGLHITYSLTSAIARVSGWRLILPADWVILLYYCVGVGQVSLWIWAYLKARGQMPELPNLSKSTAVELDWRQDHLPQIATIVFALSLFMPLTENLVVDQFFPFSKENAEVAWEEADLTELSGRTPAIFLDQLNSDVLVGRALWPRYYISGMGEPAGDWPAYNPLPFERLGFVLVGPQGNQVVLPISHAPEAFPNAAEVIVFGCREEAYFRATAIVFINSELTVLLSDFQESWTCTS